MWVGCASLWQAGTRVVVLSFKGSSGMRTNPISDHFEPAPSEPGIARSQASPSGRAMLRSGVLGEQLIRLAELAAEGDADARVFVSPAEEAAQ